MKNISSFSVILWDFDGVILDSMPIRSKGFEDVLKQYPKSQVSELLSFHEENGGLSRYVKFRYFFEKIRNEPVDEKIIGDLANQFSKIMLSLLTDESLLIEDTVSFIKKNATTYEMHIVSGSDEMELQELCKALGLSSYFRSINGSPTPKNVIVQDLLKQRGKGLQNVVLIGDSINDLEAAEYNAISFYGYNNPMLKERTSKYIEKFSS